MILKKAAAITVVSVGQKFNLIDISQHMGTTGATMEALEGGGYAILIMLPNMTEAEKDTLNNENIQVRMIRESNSLSVVMLKFGKTNLIFELTFDPTLYEDNRGLQSLHDTNLIVIYGVDSHTNVLQTIRTVSLAKELRSKWLTTWEHALRQEGFSLTYRKWYAELCERYNTVQLWNIGAYLGRMGES